MLNNNTGLFGRLRRRFMSPGKQVPMRQQRGRQAEEAARKSLCQKGMWVLARNWRCGKDEIDLICQQKDMVIFVEVRARQKDALVQGVHTLTVRKKQALLRVCQAYLRTLRNKPLHFRFDVVEVQLDGDTIHHISHYTNISLFPKNFRF